MRILFCITESMVHAVHYPICPWHQKRRALHKPGGEIKSTLPVFAGGIHFMGGKPV